MRPLLSRNSTRAQGVQAVEAVQAVGARMPGGAKCVHGKRRRECSRCSLCAPCPHGNVPRRCFKCKSPKRQAKTTVGEMLIPGFGFLTTPASLEAGIRGQPTFTRAMLCDQRFLQQGVSDSDEAPTDEVHSVWHGYTTTTSSGCSGANPDHWPKEVPSSFALWCRPVFVMDLQGVSSRARLTSAAVPCLLRPLCLHH